MLKKILLGLSAIILLLIVIAYLLPKERHVERMISINAPVETVFPLVNNLKTWTQCDPWYYLDTTQKRNYESIYEGTGAAYSWESSNSNVGNGHLKITNSVPNQLIEMDLFFMEDDKPAKGTYKFEATEKETKVVWILDANMGMNPFMRWMGMFMDKMVGTEFEKGLASLKNVAESMPVKPKTYRGFEVKETDAMEKVFIVKKDSINMDKISAFYGKNLPAIMQAIQKAKLEMAGAPSGLFFSWNDSTKMTVMAAAIPVKGDANTKVKGFETVVVPAGKELQIAYYGSYDKTGEAHLAMDEYMKEKNLGQNIPVMEEYVTDPGMEKDTAKWLTNICYPVK